MSNEIEIRIRQTKASYGVFMLIGIMGFIMCCTYFLLTLSPLLIFLAILGGAVFGFFGYLLHLPTVIWSDGVQLYWKHFHSEHSIYLAEISYVICEPYTVNSRYGAYQRIRLTLRTNSAAGDIVFNDSVNAGDLIDEKFGRARVDISLQLLSSYLTERCGIR